MGKLTCQDLMIGDWVYTHEPEGSIIPEGKAHRINEIWGISDEVTADDSWYPIGDIRPIPLTSEILVKNGFVGYHLTDSYELNTDYYEIEVWNYRDGLWVVNVHWIEFSSTPDDKLTVSYVHQLQHLLRLCGIEKEIGL